MGLFLALDRYLAVKHGVWYSQNCTRKAAWIVIVPAILIRIPDVAIAFVAAEIVPEQGCSDVGVRFINLTEQHDCLTNAENLFDA